MADYVSLNAEQLRQLASVIYYQEAEAVKTINFNNSELELAKYLNQSQGGYKSVLDLLDAGAELVNAFQDDATKGPIAAEIFSYIVNALNFSLQFLNNYLLRLNYVDKIKQHATPLSSELHELDGTNVSAAAAVSKKVVGLNKAMLKYATLYRSNASLNFSKWLKESGVKFPDLVARYKYQLKFDGPFEDLEDLQKIQVYDEIMGASGRGKVYADLLIDVLEGAGKALILFTAGLMVWDIFSSDHIFEKATRDAVMTAASVGGAVLLEDVVVAALTSAAVGLVLDSFVVVTAGIVAGLVGAFILGEFAGLLMDSIFGSGGAPLSTDGYRCYVAPMPDGRILALQIAHQ